MYSRSETLARVLNKYRISRKPLVELSSSVSSWWYGNGGGVAGGSFRSVSIGMGTLNAS